MSYSSPPLWFPSRSMIAAPAATSGVTATGSSRPRQLTGEDVFGQERGHQHVEDVDELADLEVDGDAAEGVGLLPCPRALGQVVDHVEERVAGRERDVLRLVD